MSHSYSDSSHSPTTVAVRRRSKRKRGSDADDAAVGLNGEQETTKRNKSSSNTTVTRVRSTAAASAAASDTKASSSQMAQKKNQEAAQDEPEGSDDDHSKLDIEPGYAAVALPVGKGQPLWIQVPAMISELHRVMQQELILAGDPDYDVERCGMYMLNTESSNRMVSMMREYLKAQVTPLYQQRRSSSKLSLAFLRLLSLTLVARNEPHWWTDQEDPPHVNVFMKELGHAWCVLLDGATDEQIELKNLRWDGAATVQQKPARWKMEHMLSGFKKTMMEDSVKMCDEQLYRFPWRWAD